MSSKIEQQQFELLYSYLSHRIIDSFPPELKWKIIRLKDGAYNTDITFKISLLIFVENCL